MPNNPQCAETRIKKVSCVPISLLALVEAGYKTLHFVSPNFGSSEAKTLPIAERDNWRKMIQIMICITAMHRY